jgi:tetratricopeptide (TPR) repeat protein
MKVFLSAVSAQFKACRDELASDLRAIGCEVKVQEDFQQGARTLAEKIEEYVAECDRVIALVGDAYGFEVLNVAAAPVDPPRSYTQWEYAVAMGDRRDGSRAAAKDVYVYFASDDFLVANSVDQPDEHAVRQRLFKEQLKASDKHWSQFSNSDQLCRRVLRDGWKMQRRPDKPRNLPYDSIGTLFKGRKEFLSTIGESLSGASRATVVSTVHGLGGVGKTRLAIEYALLHEPEYSALLFVTADTPEAFRRNLASLCGPLVLNLDERNAKEEDVRVAAALRWLREHPGWFLIVDNVDSARAVAEVEGALGKLAGGHVLVTSRIAQWSAGIETHELDVLDEEAGVAFLLERTGDRRKVTMTDDTDARALAKEVDGLALALEQSAALISKLRVSFAEYLLRWRARESKLREWHDELLMKYPRSVAVTWNTSFEQLGAASRALLNCLCWFASEPVPRTVFDSIAAQEAIASRDVALDAESETEDVEDAIAELASFSLLKWEKGNDAFRMHRLVAEIMRERESKEIRKKSLRAALAIVNAWVPDDPPPQDVRSWNRWNPIRPHAEAIVAAADIEGLDTLSTRLMGGLARYLRARGVWDDAERLYRRALAIDLQGYGPDHPSVATHLNDLAQVLQATNRLAEAEPLMRRVLAIDTKRDGPDHPNVAIDLANLALLLKATNRSAEAEPLMRRALEIDEQSYGPDHPDVAIDLANLAFLLVGTNRFAEAEPLMWRALKIDEQSYGPGHPMVAGHFNNLAQLLGATNRLADAERLMRRALEIDEQSYGPNHPSVARDLNNLAELLRNTNRLAEAEPLIRRALVIDERSYGPDHPDVARDLNNLALLLKATDRLTEAEPLTQRQLAIFLTFAAATGHSHPHQQLAVANYAELLRQMDHSDEQVRAKLHEVGRPFGAYLSD